MTKFNDFLAEQLQDLELQQEWNAQAPEFTIIQAMIDARKKTGLTKKQLAERCGLNPAAISKLENGNANPSLRTLQRLAAGMNTQLKIEFLPLNANKQTQNQKAQ